MEFATAQPESLCACIPNWVPMSQGDLAHNLATSSGSMPPFVSQRHRVDAPPASAASSARTA